MHISYINNKFNDTDRTDEQTHAFSCVKEEFMVTREVQQSRDCSVFGAGIEVWTERKPNARVAMEQATSRLRHRMLVVQVASERAGLGSNPSTHPDVSGSRGRARRQLVQQEVKADMEEEHATIAVDEVRPGYELFDKLAQVMVSRTPMHQVPCPVN